MPQLNLPPQTSLFFEREVICQTSIIEHWPHRNSPFSWTIERWHIRQNVAALRSMRAAQAAYDEGLLSCLQARIQSISTVRYRTGSRRRKSHASV